MKKLLLSFCLFITATLSAKENDSLRLWFNHPATIWEETLPLGNGRLGAMPDGGLQHEQIVLNDISLWSGSVQDADNPEAAQYLPEIRQLLLAGKNDEAQALMYKTFVCKSTGSGHGDGTNVPYGSFEVLGQLNLTHHEGAMDVSRLKYHRELSLNQAVASCSYQSNGVNYSREYFTSFADNVVVIRLLADKKGAINLNIGLSRPRNTTTTVKNNVLVLDGQLGNGIDQNGMRFSARVQAKIKGGKLSSGDSTLRIKAADEVILFVSMDTDYDGSLNVEKPLQLAYKKTYARLKESHITEYRKLFDRVQLRLEGSNRDDLPTDERLVAFARTGNDNGLAALYFHFGRYLLISSTHPNGLPSNLQGLWANTIRTPWNGDYHLNINVQMNHWPAEVTNLAELHRPLINLTKGLVEPGGKSAKAFYNARGWVAHMMTNVWGYTAPGEHPSWGATNTGGGWLCEHLWEHYLFNPDPAYLQEIYPVLKGASQFFLDMLIEEPANGWLVTAPSTSPENAFRLPGTDKSASVCMGPTMDNQIVRELFSNTIDAARLLGKDAEMIALLEKARAKLPPMQIGKHGQLMEWLEDYEEAEPHHRHVSHLYGLHPSNQITVEHTPELAKAARVTLERRGDGGTGWSRAWKINFWARLKDGDRAHLLLTNLLDPTKVVGIDMSNKGGTYPNLFCAHPPFQIDGNLGGCAGIAEMLLQSHAEAIEVLPALPSQWPSGSFSGLRVRGGAEISATWLAGKTTHIEMKATSDNTFRLKVPAKMQLVVRGQRSQHAEGEIVVITLKKGETCRLEA